MTRRHRWFLGWSRCIIRHIAVSYGRHCHDRPPKRIRYGFEEAVLTSGFREVHRRWKQHHTFKHIRTAHTVGLQCEGVMQAGVGRVARQWLPHVSVANSSHCYDGPPKRIRYGRKVWIGTIFISKEYCAWEHDHPCKHKILGARAPAASP